MLFLALATACMGAYFGAALYGYVVEHPARVSCGSEVAVREFRSSLPRGAIMGGALAILGCVNGALAAWLLRDAFIGIPVVSMALAVPFTVVVIRPVDKQLLDRGLDPTSERAGILLARWNRLHAVRVVLGGIAFALLLLRLASGT